MRTTPKLDPPILAYLAGAAAVVIWRLAAPGAEGLAQAVLPGLATAAVAVGLRHWGSQRELSQWRQLTLALGLLWVSEMLTGLGGGPPALGVALTALGAALVVVGSFTTRAHRDVLQPPGLQRIQILRLAGLEILALGLVAYGVIVPSWGSDPSQPPPSGAGPLLLLGAAAAAYLAGATPPSRWRSTYGLLTVAFGSLGLRDWHDGAVEQILLLVGLTAWVFAARRPSEDDQDRTLPPARPWRIRVPVTVSFAVLPAFHLSLATAGLLPPDTAAGRQATTLGILVALGGLAVAEHLAVRRRTHSLEHQHRRAARETEERSFFLDALIEHSPLAIVVLSPDHRVTLCNPAFEALFQYRADEVVGSTLDLLIATSETRAQAAGFSRRVMRGESIHDTAVRLRKDGVEVDVEIFGVPLVVDGELLGVFGLYLDVSDRLRAERDLRETEERFRRLSEATFEGIVVSDGGTILDCNEQYAEMVGLTPEQVIGRPVADFVSERDREMVARRVEEDDESPYEHRALRADGRELLVEIRGRAFPFGGRQVRVAAVRDITTQKRFEDEVRQSQKMEAVGRLAGGIAHDFNNVLTVIKGYSQLLGFQIQDERLRGQAEEILQAAERAKLMTQRLLAFGRKQAIQPQVLELDGVVRGMEKMLRRLIRADIEIRIEGDPELGKIRADPSQIEQVILNLAINAGDAMPGGGVLTLTTASVRLGPNDTNPVPYLAPGSFVRLTVSDTGTGMDPETLDQVFEPFFTTKEKGKGTGLGLATVYAIVKQNGGIIDVDSHVGEGTAFRVFLPRMSEITDEPRPLDPAPQLPRGDETVLVVEDEAGVRELAVTFLESHGYRVLEAPDGVEGLRKLSQGDPEIDLVLTDVVMPGLNGPAMVARATRNNPGLKVLYMSGYTD
ncbi:MAG: PAS domain S-box protein, partial [Acidobacteriota bacterium]